VTTWEYAHARGAGLLGRVPWKSLRAAAGKAWDRVRPVAMTVCGLGCITAGLFTVSTLAGLIAAGLSFFVVDWVAK
jgi:hypothetical protein